MGDEGSKESGGGSSYGEAEDEDSDEVEDPTTISQAATRSPTQRKRSPLYPRTGALVSALSRIAVLEAGAGINAAS
jgi:hypothetical protein